MRNLKSIFVFLFIFTFFNSCNNELKFEKSGWIKKDEIGNYPNRKAMLNNLMENYNLTGLTYTQIVDLLGEPENYSDFEAGVIYYNIITDYNSDIDPVYVQNLKILLDENKKVRKYIIFG